MRRLEDDPPMTASSEPRPPVSRIRLAQQPDFRLAQLVVRPSLREVIDGGRRELLEPRVMQVLAALATLRGRVVSREELTQACWEGRIVGEDALNRTISHLRRIADRSGGAFTIDTIPRVGYRLSEGDAEAPSPAELPQRSPARRPTAVADFVSFVARALRLARD